MSIRRLAAVSAIAVMTFAACSGGGSSAAPSEAASVAPTTLGQDAPLLGAAELAFEPLLNDPAAWLRPRHLAVASVSA